MNSQSQKPFLYSSVRTNTSRGSPEFGLWSNTLVIELWLGISVLATMITVPKMFVNHTNVFPEIPLTSFLPSLHYSVFILLNVIQYCCTTYWCIFSIYKLSNIPNSKCHKMYQFIQNRMHGDNINMMINIANMVGRRFGCLINFKINQFSLIFFVLVTMILILYDYNRLQIIILQYLFVAIGISLCNKNCETQLKHLHTSWRLMIIVTYFTLDYKNHFMHFIMKLFQPFLVLL